MLNLRKINSIEVLNYKGDENSNYSSNWNTWLINGKYAIQTEKLEVAEVRKNWYLGKYTVVAC